MTDSAQVVAARPSDGYPSDLQARLIAAARAGQLLDLADGAPIDPADMDGWGDDRTIRAEVLRDLLLGRHGELDPHGVQLRGARIAGGLDLDDVRTAIALRLTDCHAPTIRARRAHLPQLELIGVRTTEVDAEGLRVDHDLNLTRLRATGAGHLGVIRLLDAHIGGTLQYDGAQLTSTNGPALSADRLQVTGSMFLDNGFQATGGGPKGVVRLHGAHIGGQLDCRRGGSRHHERGLDLDLSECQVGQLLLDPGFEGRLDAQGLRYGGIPGGPTVDDWLRWYRNPGPGLGYAAQPYQHLAAAHRAAGHETDARRILIAQQHDLYQRGGLTGWLRFRHRLLGLTLGYGYQSWRALIGLAATLAVAVTLAVTAGAQSIAVHTKDTATPGTHCSLVEQLGLGVDLATPLINTGAKARCALSTDHNTAGSVLTAAGWLLQLSGFAFATLFIAGFTGIIRKQ